MVRMVSINKRSKASIKINGKEFYDYIEVVYTKDYSKVSYGNCLYFIKYQNGESETGIRIPPNLETSVNDFSFVLDLFKYRELEIDGIIYEANKESKINQDLLTNYRNNLEYCRNLEKVFDAFSLDKNYDLEKMSDQEKQLNAMLISCIVFKNQ